MAAEYEDAHLIACANAITNLGNRIGLYYGNTRVGTVYADTTWGTATAITESSTRKGQRTGSTVTINVPASTVPNGTVIDKYAVFNGTTLLRKQTLPVSLTVNDGSQAFSVDVTPLFKYSGV